MKDKTNLAICVRDPEQKHLCASARCSKNEAICDDLNQKLRYRKFLKMLDKDKGPRLSAETLMDLERYGYKRHAGSKRGFLK